jgi:hypothetical protein
MRWDETGLRGDAALTGCRKTRQWAALKGHGFSRAVLSPLLRSKRGGLQADKPCSFQFFGSLLNLEHAHRTIARRYKPPVIVEV